MVVTHASVKKQKATPIIKKEDNLNRLHMTHDEALADNARIIEEREKVAAFRASLKKEGTAAVVVTPAEQVVVKPKISSDVDKLKRKMESIKGPGSKAKKEKIQAEIDAIEGRVHENIS